jgi:hypothetical protein
MLFPTDIASSVYKTMKHPNKIEKYPGSLAELAKELGNLKYNSLAKFLKEIGDDLINQAKTDREKGRLQLASHLEASAQKIYEARDRINSAWDICEPYMKKSPGKKRIL